MPETGLSAAVVCAWQIAADTALQSGADAIAPDHLLLGIFSVEKIFSSTAQQELRMQPDTVAGVRAEWEALVDAFAHGGSNPTMLRRRLRSQLHLGATVNAHGKVSRSPEVHAIFARAGDLSRLRGVSPTGLLPLTAALVDYEAIAGWLRKENVEVLAVRSALWDAPLDGLQETAVAQPFRSTPDISGPLLAEPPAQAPPKIEQTLDATVAALPPNPGAAGGRSRQLASLYELPWLLGSHATMDALLPQMLEQLLVAIPGAQRGAVVLLDATTGAYLLKAHLPPGAPAVSLTAVEQAIQRRCGFIWHQDEDLTLSQRESGASSGMYAPLVWSDRVFGAICIDSGDTGAQFHPDDLVVLVSASHQAALAIANYQLGDELRRNANILERLLTSFSPKVRNRLLDRARNGRLRLGGERSEVTILYSDIRGFTRLSAGRDADEIVDLLNDVFAALTEAIFNNDGTIDKYIGDAILAVFGSPDPDPQQHAKAVLAATQMQAAIAQLNEVRQRKGRVTCDIGIGIHCGEVLHGFIGTAERMEFTVIGDAVNRASRYCAAAPGGQILISPELYQRVWKLVEAEPLTIPTKHEGDFPSYRIRQVRSRASN